MLVCLVMFVFVILLISVAVSGIISFFLMRIGFIPSLLNSRFPPILGFMLLVSLVIGTLLSSIGGAVSLRPLRKLIDATKEVTAGNFSVKVQLSGPEEFQRLSASFNEMTKELSSIETLRSDFVSNISHEFKTPVVSIRGFAKLLKKDTLSKEQRDEYLDIIISESERLTALSSNVLLLSNLESTDRIIEIAPFSLDEQIRRCILLLEPQLQKKQLELAIDLNPVDIIANEEILQHIWINLLSNAIKFSTEQGTVEIKLFSDGDNAVISISDTGIGMGEDVQKHLFDKFYQADSSRSTEGNGLGLSLVKRILDLSHGQISVDSTPGKGTCFTVTLPLKESQEPS